MLVFVKNLQNFLKWALFKVNPVLKGFWTASRFWWSHWINVLLLYVEMFLWNQIMLIFKVLPPRGRMFLCFFTHPVYLLQVSAFIAPLFSCPIFPSCSGVPCQEIIYLLECSFSAIKWHVPLGHGFVGSKEVTWMISPGEECPHTTPSKCLAWSNNCF